MAAIKDESREPVTVIGMEGFRASQVNLADQRREALGLLFGVASPRRPRVIDS